MQVEAIAPIQLCAGVQSHIDARRPNRMCLDCERFVLLPDEGGDYLAPELVSEGGGWACNKRIPAVKA